MVDDAPARRLFDAAWYLAAYPNVGGDDPWADFCCVGAEEGRDPNPMFSTAWYLRRYPDVARSGLSALEDYLGRGVALGRDPGPLFNTRWYLASNPDVGAAGINPLEHYLSWGMRERRDPSPVFDSVWYFSGYPDAAAPDVDARLHYMEQGALLGYDPCLFFSTPWYLETYPEVAASGENPLLHYLINGAAKGLDPSPYFSTSQYLESHRELVASGENPLVHYLAQDASRVRGTANTATGVLRRPSGDAIAEARRVIRTLAEIEPDLAAVAEALESLPVRSFALDRGASAWRKLYLSIYELPQRLVLVGSIDDALELAGLPSDRAGLLVVETDVQLVATAELLPRGTQWRSLSEFGADLDEEERVRVVTALVNGLQPAAVLVWGSRAGWEMLARHGAAMRRYATLFATAEAAPETRAGDLLRSYFRTCIPVLSALYGPDEQELHRVADLFGLPPGERGKLRDLGDWQGADGFFAALGDVAMTAVTVVLNVHREGILAHASLLSIAAARQAAEAAGLAVEVLAVADCSDGATLDTLAEAAAVRVLETTVDDLGLARNVGVAAASGQYVAFLDGDDLWGPSWLRAAHEAAVREPAPVVWHPEASLLFGPKQEPHWLVHPDIETAEGDWVTLGIRNQWTALSFARRDTYLRIPYRRTDLRAGFGYEDWSWNSEVVAQGFRHKPVPGTTHLVRVQDTSLLRRTEAARALMMPSTLLRRRIGWAVQVGSVGVAALPAADCGLAPTGEERT